MFYVTFPNDGIPFLCKTQIRGDFFVEASFKYPKSFIVYNSRFYVCIFDYRSTALTLTYDQFFQRKKVEN